jgi:hypothetical protein
MESFEVSVRVQLNWQSRIETSSPELNRLIESVSTNATLLARTADFIRMLREQIDNAVAQGQTLDLAQFSAELHAQSEQLAHVITVRS